MISKNSALKVLNESLKTGGDFAEIFLEETQNQSVNIDSSRTESPSTSMRYGAGIRILNKLQSVYGYTNDVSTKGLLSLASSLASSFNEERQLTVEKISTLRYKKRHLIQRPLDKVDLEEKITLLKSIEKIIREYDPLIVRSIVGLSNVVRNIEVFNSEGKHFTDQQQRIRIFLQAMASKDGVYETSFSGPGALQGFEYLSTLDLINEAKKVAKLAVDKLSAKDCPSGKMPVVIGNGFGGVIFHEAVGHPLEASAIAKGYSQFTNKVGQRVAHECVTAIDDGTIENGWGSFNIDDEGNVSTKNVLIEKGILKGYMVDRFNGRRMNAESTGAGRRQSYKYEPTSRMTNSYIAAGESTVEEIISSVKLGLYAKSLGGGSVNPATGDFNFAADEAYIIRDGKVCELVKGATLIGSGAEVLANIDMVANDLARAQGMCGAASGSIPVDVGQPTIRVSQITVGGQGGVLK